MFKSKGRLGHSGRGIDFEVFVHFQCPDCDKKIKECIYSAKTEYMTTRRDWRVRYVGAASGCSRCGWILIKLPGGFPTQKQIDKNFEVDLLVTRPEPSP